MWKDAKLVTIYKTKGVRAECDCSRVFVLFAVAGKVLAKMLSRRVASSTGEKLIPESQCVFRPSRGIFDMIFVARQLEEKCREQHVGLHMAFVDLSKAFDRVPRELLWDILKHFGCQGKFFSLIRSIHDNMSVRVSASGVLSEEFEVTGGIKQGCVMAPVLYQRVYALCNASLTSRSRECGSRCVIWNEKKLVQLDETES